MRRQKTCAYCGETHGEPGYVPDEDDRGEWQRLAALHAAGCEWIETRAHMMSVPAKRED